MVLTFSNNNESISLPPELSLGSGVTPERMKLQRNTEDDEDQLCSYKLADASLSPRGAESKSLQDHGIARKTNYLGKSSTFKTEVKQGDSLHSFKVPNKMGDVRFDHCQFLCKNTSAGIDLNFDTEMSLLDRSTESEVRLQSLPLQTVNLVNPDEIVKETKHREMQKRDKIKQHFKTKRNEMLGRSQEKGKYKDQVEPTLSNDNNQGKMSGEYSLPRPSIAFGRETETRNTAEKHETAAPLQQSKLSNAQKTDFNSTTITNTHFQTTASKTPCNFEIKNEEQIALSPKEDKHDLEGRFELSMMASHPPQMLARSRNTNNDENINVNHTKDKSRQANIVATTPKTNKKHESPSNIDENNNDTWVTSKHQNEEAMVHTNLLKAENTRQGETSSFRGESGHTNLSIVKTRKPREDLGKESDGNSDRSEDKKVFTNDALYHKEKSRKGMRKISKEEKKGLSKVNIEDNESEPAEENLEQLRQINKTLKESKLCKVCRDKDANRLFLPCAHLACCSLCSPAVRNCPQCKGNIRGIVSVYFG